MAQLSSVDLKLDSKKPHEYPRSRDWIKVRTFSFIILGTSTGEGRIRRNLGVRLGTELSVIQKGEEYGGRYCTNFNDPSTATHCQ